MSLRALFLLAALALLQASAPPAHGQEEVAPGVPHGDATIRGRVVHAERGPEPGVEVLLYALPADAPPGVRRAASGADGRFVFDAIDGNPTTTYLVGARYQQVSYPGARVKFGAGERDREVEVRVHETTEETSAAVPRELRMRLDWTGARLEVSEDLTVENGAARTVFIPEKRRAGRAAAVELGLPAGADHLSGPLNLLPEGVEIARNELRWFGPVYPGGAELGYHYDLPAPIGAMTLERSLPATPIRVSVLALIGGPVVEAPGLTEGEQTVVSGRGYRVYSGELAGRLTVKLSVPAARHDPAAVSVAEVRILGELDAAAFSGREEHVIEVSGDGPVVAADETPLVAIPLPVEAADLRFGAPASATRLVPLPDGSGVGVMGPLSPGETVLEVHYRLPADGGPFALTRHFAAHVPLLSVYLADTGDLRVDSERLHRRRAAKTPDRTYLHLEAFELAPGEKASFTVTTRPPRRDLPRAAVIGLVALVTGLAALALAAPVRHAAAPADAAGEPEIETAAERESEAIGAALEDLEHDFETGKLDAADHALLRSDLTAALARGRAASAKSAASAVTDDLPAPVAPRACGACGQPAVPGARFCAHCGAKLA